MPKLVQPPLTTPVTVTDGEVDFYNNHPWVQFFEGVYFNGNLADNFFNVLDFGAKNDGKTDSTKAINTAINQARLNGGGWVHMPSGNYLVSGPINVTGFTNGGPTLGAIVLSGDGGYQTTLSSTVNGQAVIDLTGSNMIRLANFSIKTLSGVANELILMARDVTNAGAANNFLDNLWIQGACNHALITNFGSEQNIYSRVICVVTNDCPAYVGSMSTATPPGGNGTASGWLPTSTFQTVGTGNGGIGANQFIGCTFLRNSLAVPTTALFYHWGMNTTLFDACFWFCRGTSVDMRAIPNPSFPTLYYQTSATFDTCSDENSIAAAKNSILCSDPGTTSVSSVNGLHIYNCGFMTIQSDNNVWVDDLELNGGRTGYMQGGTITSKMSIWRLDNAKIFPSLAERGYTYTVRNQGSGLVFGAIPIGNLILAGASYSVLDITSSAQASFGFLGTSPSVGVGYYPGFGAGGTVTQLTSKSTAVSLNKITGQITMNNATLNAGTTVGFALNNTSIAATDSLIVNIQSGASANSYSLNVVGVAANTATIELRNTSAGNLSEAVVINFAILKGANS